MGGRGLLRVVIGWLGTLNCRVLDGFARSCAGENLPVCDFCRSRRLVANLRHAIDNSVSLLLQGHADIPQLIGFRLCALSLL